MTTNVKLLYCSWKTLEDLLQIGWRLLGDVSQKDEDWVECSRALCVVRTDRQRMWHLELLSEPEITDINLTDCLPLDSTFGGQPQPYFTTPSPHRQDSTFSSISISFTTTGKPNICLLSCILNYFYSVCVWRRGSLTAGQLTTSSCWSSTGCSPSLWPSFSR